MGDPRAENPRRSGERLLLRIVPDEAAIKQAWDEYVADCQWYADNGQMSPGHPDPGYARNEPTPWLEYRAQSIAHFVDETVGEKFWYRVEVVE